MQIVFESVLMLFTKNIKLIHACRNYTAC